MKSITFLLLFLINSYGLFAQLSWTTQLPDFGIAQKMIKTIDNNYVILALLDDPSYGVGGQNKLGLYKYNNSGTLLWANYYTHTDSGTFDTNLEFIQLQNGTFVVAGNLNWKPLLALFDSSGDTLWVKRYNNYPTSNFFRNPVDMYEFNQIWLTGGGLPDQKAFVHKIDYNGNILAVDSNGISIPPGGSYYGNKMIKISSDTLLFSTYQGAFMLSDLSYFKYDTAQYSIKPLKLRKNPVYGYNIHDDAYYSPVTSTDDGKGLVKLGNNLDSIWSIPVAHYYGYGASLFGSPSDLIITQDYGIAMCGSMYFNNHYYPYLIKTDSVGNPLIIKLYSGVIPTGARNLFEEDDHSFIMLQSGGSYYNIFIIRTNPDGSINNELIESQNYGVKIFPNPTNEQLTIQCAIEFTGMVDLFNISGEKLLSKQILLEKQFEFDMKTFKPGDYIIKIYNSKGKIFTEQIIKY